MTSNTTYHQDFKIVSNDIEGFSFQNGTIRLDTGTNKTTTLSQGTEPRIQVSDAGAITMTARENQNINLNASGAGKVNISGLDLTVYGVKKQVLHVPHELGEQALSVITPTSGSLSVHISGESEGGSDAAACFMCAKRVGAKGVCNTVTSVAGTNGETLGLQWENNTITLKVTGTLESYAAAQSDFNVRILCSQ